MIARIRKAIVAGGGAGLAASAGVVGKALEAGVFSDATVQQALGAFILAALAIGPLAYRVPNAPAQQ